MTVSGGDLSAAKRALLEQRLRGVAPAGDRAGAVTPRSSNQSIPLSVAQEQLWYFAQTAPDNPVYNELISIRKAGPLDRGALEYAVTQLVRRHEAWRSTFVLEGERAVQLVQPPSPIDVPLTDLSDLPRDAAQQEATALAAELARRPYHLDEGPLLRPLLVRFAAQEHRLFLAMHHIIFDGVSLYRVILPELIALYEAYVAGTDPALAEPSIQYADYALWSQRWVSSDEFARHIAYWREHLDNSPELHLPLDHPRPRQQRFRGAMEGIRLPRELVERLRALSAAGGATLFQVLATAFAVLLHRHAAGQDEVVFGTVSDLRKRPELERMVGYCVTSVVLRADLAGDPSFLQLLPRVRRELLDALAHPVPFGRLVSELQPARDPGINPLFQAMLVLEPPLPSPDPSWSLHLMEAEIGTAVGNAKLDINFELDARAEGHIDGRLIYNSDLFEPQTAKRLASRWLTLLEAVCESPERPVSELPLLAEDEIHEQVVEWNRTDGDLPLTSCVHDLVVQQAQRTPDAIAVSGSAGELTYAQLADQAGRLAAYLRERGVAAEVRVGICLERSLEMVVALLAVLEAGGAFVPLEPDQPRERLAHMVDDAEPAVILTTAALASTLPATTAAVVHLDSERASWMAGAPTTGISCGPDNLAYVLFTSGSTGTPKGVMVEHRSLVNQLAWRIDTFGLGPEDRVLQKTPLGFDVSLWEFFCPLMVGARIVLLEPGGHRDPALLAGAIRTHGVTAMQFVPSLLQASLGALATERCHSVRVLASGGEALSPTLVRQAFECFGQSLELHNVYGPTEATLDALSWRCDVEVGTVPIGRPVANTQVYLLDEHAQPVPIGVAGELCIGGVQVGRGYLKRAELTAERFVDNPFRPAERMYRTGDLARYRGDGSVEFLGRRDSQVKIRGNRIELGEVEAALSSHPHVAEVVATAWDDPASGERRLVAYVVPATQEVLGLAELREHAVRLLPDPMVPAAFVVLDGLPLTRNGKLDRRALPAPEDVRLAPEAAYVAPRTAAEAALVEIWEDLLHVQRVGVDDNFFELGGDSILSIQIAARANRAGLRIAPGQLFEHQTVARLAAAVDSVKAAAEENGTGQHGAESGASAAEFSLAGVDQATLERLLGR